MTYPYGTHGAPAVGGGLPGLPRRGEDAPAPSPGQFVDLSAYKYLVLKMNSIAMFDGMGELIAYEIFPYSLPVESQIALDYGQELFILTAGDVTAALRNLTVYSTKDLSVVSKVMLNESYTSSTRPTQAAIHTGLGLVAISSRSTVRVYSLSDILNADGGNISDLTPVSDISELPSGDGAEHGLEWNTQGTLLARSRTTFNAYLNVIKWPSLETAFNDSYAVVAPARFSHDGVALGYVKAATTVGGSPVNRALRIIEYDSSGEYVSSERVDFYEISGDQSGEVGVGGFDGQYSYVFRGLIRDYVPGLDPEIAMTSIMQPTNATTALRHSYSPDGRVLFSSAARYSSVSIRRENQTRPADPYLKHTLSFDNSLNSGENVNVRSVRVVQRGYKL